MQHQRKIRTSQKKWVFKKPVPPKIWPGSGLRWDPGRILYGIKKHYNSQLKITLFIIWLKNEQHRLLNLHLKSWSVWKWKLVSVKVKVKVWLNTHFIASVLHTTGTWWLHQEDQHFPLSQRSLHQTGYVIISQSPGYLDIWILATSCCTLHIPVLSRVKREVQQLCALSNCNVQAKSANTTFLPIFTILIPNKISQQSS